LWGAPQEKERGERNEKKAGEGKRGEKRSLPEGFAPEKRKK
jgi:hypothetical protein